MQALHVFNATVSPTSIRGLGRVNAASRRDGHINQITFDDDFAAYKSRAAKFGILLRDPTGSFEADGYANITAVAALEVSDRFVVATTDSGNYVLTLMAANAVPANTIVYFFHEDGSNTATITRAGADTINGGTTLALNTANPVRRLRSNGVSAWTSV